MMQSSTTPPVPRFETSYDDRSTVDRLAIAPRLTRWGAIVAGAFAAISAQVVFAVLGTAIGLSVITASYDTPEQGISIGAGIWWLCTGLVSLFFGGWIAGRLTASADRNTGATNGFLSWCTVMVLSAVMLAIAGGSAVSGSLALAGNQTAANNRISGQSLSDARLSAAEQDSRIASSRSAETSGGQRGVLTDREQEQAAKNAAAASWWTLFALVFGAAAALLGGMAGVRTYEQHSVDASFPRTRVEVRTA